MRYGLCTEIANLHEAHAAGYDFAELRMGELLPDQDDATFASVRELLLASPIPIESCNCFVPATCKVVGPEVDMPVVADYMARALSRAAQVGARVVVFGSGAARQAPEGFPLEMAHRQFADAARMAADIAAKYGITIAIEPLCSTICNVLNTEQQGARLIEEIDKKNLRLLADIYHMRRQREPITILPTVATHLAHVHVDSVRLPAPPAGGDDDTPAFFAALASCGYEGRISLEDNSGNIFIDGQDLTRVEAYARQLGAMKDYWKRSIS